MRGFSRQSWALRRRCLRDCPVPQLVNPLAALNALDLALQLDIFLLFLMNLLGHFLAVGGVELRD